MKEEKDYMKELETPLRTKMQRESWTSMITSTKGITGIHEPGEQPPSTPGAYWPTPRKLCGGSYCLDGDGYDPQPKSLGRWTDDIEYYYSKITKDGQTKKSTMPHKLHAGRYIIDRHAYAKQCDATEAYEIPAPEGPGASYYYSKEIIEDSYSGYDIEKQRRYLETRWGKYLTPTKAERAEPKGTFSPKSCEDLDGDYKVSYEIIDGKLKILS